MGDLVSPAEAVRQAAAAPKGPVVLLYVGDNVGGGSPADPTRLFQDILDQRVPNASSFYISRKPSAPVWPRVFAVKWNSWWVARPAIFMEAP